MTPLSKPNRKPPMVATQLIGTMKRAFSALLSLAMLSLSNRVSFIPLLQRWSDFTARLGTPLPLPGVAFRRNAVARLRCAASHAAGTG